MAKITWNAGCMLSPLPPVMVTCGTMEKSNILTIAWTGIVNSEPPMTYISVRKERFSHHIISETKEFVINLSNLSLAAACDFCGVRSGKNINKWEATGLTPSLSKTVSCPSIAEAPVSLECKVVSVTELGSHDMFLAEITSVNVDDSYLNENGKLELEKAGLLTYVHGGYYTLGRYLGKFGFSVEKKPKDKAKNKKAGIFADKK